jgi:hypothetical protein
MPIQNAAEVPKYLPSRRAVSAAKRGLFYRPVKQQLTLRLDADVVAWFKNHTTSNEGYQTRINRIRSGGIVKPHSSRHARRFGGVPVVDGDEIALHRAKS